MKSEMRMGAVWTTGKEKRGTGKSEYEIVAAVNSRSYLKISKQCDASTSRKASWRHVDINYVRHEQTNIQKKRCACSCFDVLRLESQVLVNIPPDRRDAVEEPHN